MKVVRLKISNFRTVSKAELHFDGHTLLVGPNNIGKSTICEALDLALGPDRINRFPPVDEWDFYNGKYLTEDCQPILIQIEVVLLELSDEVTRLCNSHLEFWDRANAVRVQEIGAVDDAEPCLRLSMIAAYNPEEDEFEAGSYFSHSPEQPEGELKKVGKNIKRLFGFLYLRTIRTGNRALSLERGSLLDIILRADGKRAGLWESTLQRLSSLDPPIDEGAEELQEVLKSIESKIEQYVPLAADGRSTRLHVSNLTREHLRKTLSFFLTTDEGQSPVPFQRVGAGTLNALVLALLSYIADLKTNIIFAMEEPEIALPPHTQRRIVKYLLTQSAQCFVTSHSPYVIEGFDPSAISVLQKEGDSLVARKVDLSSGLKPKNYHQNLRRMYAEAMLSNLVIVGEGITEVAALRYVAEVYESHHPDVTPLDIAGISVMPADGDGQLLALGKFLKSLSIPAYAFCDSNPKKTTDDLDAIRNAYAHVEAIAYAGMEKLLSEEVALQYQWIFLEELRDNAELNEGNKHSVPVHKPSDDDIRSKTFSVLKKLKGSGSSALLLSYCPFADIPAVFTDFLEKVYSYSHRDGSANDESQGDDSNESTS